MQDQGAAEQCHQGAHRSRRVLHQQPQRSARAESDFQRHAPCCDLAVAPAGCVPPAVEQPQGEIQRQSVQGDIVLQSVVQGEWDPMLCTLPRHMLIVECSCLLYPCACKHDHGVLLCAYGNLGCCTCNALHLDMAKRVSKTYQHNWHDVAHSKETHESPMTS